MRDMEVGGNTGGGGIREKDARNGGKGIGGVVRVKAYERMMIVRGRLLVDDGERERRG